MSGTQALLLSDIGDIDAKLLSRVHKVEYLLPLIAHHHYNTANPVLRQRLNHILKDWLARYGKHYLGPVNRKRPEPPPLTRCQNYRLFHN